MRARLRRESGGFTIPELIVALVGLFILLAVVGFILRPQDHTTTRYDAERRLNLAVLLQAINKYQADHNGALPDGIPDEYAFIGTQDGQVDLCKALVPKYLEDLPLDTYTGAKAYSPVNENDLVTDEQNQQPCNVPNMVYMTGYAIAKDKDGRIQLAVLGSDLETPVFTMSQK